MRGTGYISGNGFKYFQNQANAFSSRIVVSHFKHEYNFLTCDGRYNQSESYSMYTGSFDTPTWLSLLFTFTLLAFLAYLLISKEGMSDSSWLFLYGILLEVAPEMSQKFHSKLQLTVPLLPYLFSGIILANIYRGFLSAALIALLPTKGLETFDQVLESNLTIFMETTHNLGDIFREFCPYPAKFPPDKRASALKLFGSLQFIREIDTLSRLLKNNSASVQRRTVYENIKKQARILYKDVGNSCSAASYQAYSSMYNQKNTLPNEEIVHELIQCKKTIFALQWEDIYPFLVSLNPKLQNKLYHGNIEKMQMFKFGNQYYELHTPQHLLNDIYIKRNVEGLSAGGFLHYWEALMEWSPKRKYQKEEWEFNYKLKQPNVLEITGKCRTIFYIFLAGIFTSALVAAVEYIYYNLMILFLLVLSFR